MAILTTERLSKNFGGIKAIQNINLTIEEGEIVGLIGPNGAGKTTFFNLLTGLYEPTHGQIKYNLDSVITNKALKPHKMAEYGISRTFQNIRLFNDMTVLENVLMGFHNSFNYKLIDAFFKLPSYFKNEKETYNRALELLNRLDLIEKKDILAKNLPYGDQRRLEIARALASNPKILLLDEPAAGMNPKETKDLIELIKGIRDAFDLTIILIEHDMSLVMNICEHIFVFDYGHVVADGKPEEIQKDKRVIQAYLGEEEQ